MRPGVSYVERTAALVAMQRPRSTVRVFSDGPCSAVLPWAPVVWHKSNHSTSFWRMMSVARESGDDLIALEDDLEFSKGAIHAMEDFAVPGDVAAVTFLSDQFASYAQWGLYRAPCLGIRMLQAIKIPLRTLEILASIVPGIADAEAALVRALGFQLKLRYGIHIPDLVSHVGLVSSGERGASPPLGTTWRGADFDASNLRSAHELGLYD